MIHEHPDDMRQGGGSYCGIGWYVVSFCVAQVSHEAAAGKGLKAASAVPLKLSQHSFEQRDVCARSIRLE